MRSALGTVNPDRAPWSRIDQDEFLAEVSGAYRLNIAMLAELKERWA
jgi:hypothetical protein